MAVQIKGGSEADKDETGKECSDKQVKTAIAQSIVKRRYGCHHVVRLAYKKTVSYSTTLDEPFTLGEYSAREKEGPEKKKGRTEARP